MLDGIIHSNAVGARVDDVRGELGSGKTWVVRRLADHAPPWLVAVDANLEDYNPGHPNEVGARASVGAVQSSYREFHRLLAHLVGELFPPAVAASFDADVTRAHDAEVTGARLFSLEESMQEVDGLLDPSTLADSWRSAAREVSRAFTAVWNRWSPGRNRLLLLDNLDEVMGQELGVWLVDLLPALEDTTTVVTRRPDVDHRSAAVFPGLPEDRLRRFEVAPFDPDEVKRFLADRAGTSVPDEVARSVHEATGGHPATLAIVADLLLDGSERGDVERLAELRALPAQGNERTAVLIEWYIAHLEDPALERAVQAAAIARRFDTDLLRAMLEGDGLAAETSALYERLSTLPITERLTTDGGLLRIHSYVRDGLVSRLERSERPHYRELHERAAAFFEGHLLREDAPTPGSSGYGDMHVYERADWRAAEREWLHHQGHVCADPQPRAAMLLRCIRVFLDAFWWWGNYVHFDFCDQLATDLEQLSRRFPRSPGSGAWRELETTHEAFRRILQGYPLRSAKAGHGRWESVYDALLALQRVCGLQQRAGRPLSELQVQVGALLDVFLAHTWRYGRQDVTRADFYYARAAEAFTETWNRAWIAYERADLRFDAGQPEGMEELWYEAAALAQPTTVGADPLDEEVVSNLHRLRADVCWAADDLQRGTEHYTRAVTHAYLFHFTENPPDEYTLQFYVDIRARALNHLLATWRRDQPLAVELAVRMGTLVAETFGDDPPVRAAVADRFEEGTPLPLALELFPAGPQLADLGTDTSPFAERFNRRHEMLDQVAAATDLHDRAWP